MTSTTLPPSQNLLLERLSLLYGCFATIFVTLSAVVCKAHAVLLRPSARLGSRTTKKRPRDCFREPRPRFHDTVLSPGNRESGKPPSGGSSRTVLSLGVNLDTRIQGAREAGEKREGHGPGQILCFKHKLDIFAVTASGKRDHRYGR